MNRRPRKPHGQPSEAKRRPFRIGVWCDYGFTLTPLGGIGVFVYNLIAGLFEQEEPIEVVMLVREGDQHVTSLVKNAGPGRLDVIPRPTTELVPPPKRLWQKWHGQWQRLREKAWSLRCGLRERSKGVVLPILKKARAGNLFWWPAVVVCLPVGFLLLWVAYAIGELMVAGVHIAALPLKWAAQAGRHFWEAHIPPTSIPRTSMSPLEMAQQANCDVWVIPYLKLDHPLPFPSVLFIRDLVTSHFPDMFDPEFVNSINRLAPARAAEAVLCACMSAFIRDTDLLGILGLPPSKVRMVPFAAPRDFPEVTAERSQLLKMKELIRPYVFLPAGIRGYKNQRNLILALPALRDDYGQKGIDLVFTGEIKGHLPKDMEELVREGDLKDRVHVLGPVDRETLAALYQCALATIVPSLYEECSFPVSEALYWGCPLACSRIPAHVEQCAPMGDSMLYFDPNDPREIARTILHIRDNWQNVRDRQRAASAAVFRWTWKDATREWLLIFKEAAAMAHPLSNEASLEARLSGQTKAA